MSESPLMIKSKEFALNIIKACKEMGVTVREEPYFLEQLFDADEVLVSSAGALCLVADEIDGKAVGGKAPELLKSLQDIALKEFTEATDA